MIVETGIYLHPKFIQLKTLVGDIAMELLIRLWGHCQAKRGQWWPGATPDYIEVICSGGKGRRTYFEALRESGWIVDKGNGIEIHDWNWYNKNLLARWDRDKKEKHAPAKAVAKRSVQVATYPPMQIVAQGSAQTHDHSMTRQDEGDETGEDRTGAGPPLDPDSNNGPEIPGPDAAVGGSGEVNCPPSKTEVLDYAKKTGIPEGVANDFFDHYQSLHWITKGGQLADFRPRLDKWNRKDIEEAAGRPVVLNNGQTNRIGLEKAAVLLRQKIAGSPANPESASSVADPSEAQKTIYRQDKKKLREIEEKLTTV